MSAWEGSAWQEAQEQARRTQQGIGQLQNIQVVSPPRDAAGLIAAAEKRIAEIDRQLASVSGLQDERDRLARIVATKEPTGAT